MNEVLTYMSFLSYKDVLRTPKLYLRYSKPHKIKTQ